MLLLKLLGYLHVYANISRKSKINVLSSTLELHEVKKLKKELYNKIIPFCNSGILKNFANFWPRETFSY